MKSHERFEKNHKNYIDSPVHKESPSLMFINTFFNNLKIRKSLDVACGAGHLSYSLADNIDELVLLDPSPSMLNSAEILIKDKKTNVECIEAFAEDLPFKDGTFELVMTRLASHHFRSIERFIQEASRVLKPGGFLGIIDLESFEDPFINSINHELELLHDPTHNQSYSIEEIRKNCLSTGFKEVIFLSEQQEAPFGVHVDKWCKIASTSEENKSKILNILEGLTNENLCKLRINKKNDGYYMPVKSFTYISIKS